MLCAWAVGSTASAQVLFTETFTGGAPVAGFTNVQTVGTTPWSFNNPLGRVITGASFDANFAIFDSDAAGYTAGPATASLTSPAFDASVAGTYELDFSQQFRDGFGGVGAVEVFNGTTWNAVLNYGAGPVGYPDPAVATNVDITAATGGSAVAQVRFTFSGDYAWWWAVDNISVERLAPPACVVPIVSTSNITSTSVDVSWTCASCTGTYIVEYGAPGFTPGTDGTAGVGGTIWTGAPVAGSPVTISGLSALTAYQVYVRQDCGGSLYSANSAVSNVTTACAGTTCNYLVRIGDIFGDGWDGTEWVVRQNGVVIATVGPQLPGGCGPVDIPVTVCEGATLELEWTVLGGFTAEKALQFYDPFGVLLYDHRGTSTATGCPGVNWTSVNSAATTGVKFTTTANCTPPACPIPNTVTASNVTFDSADINYLCNACSGTYIIEYGVAPFNTPGTGATAGAGGTVVTSATLTGALSGVLAPSTTYNVYVRQECTPGVLYSDNSIQASFTTPCGLATAPYTQGFEAYGVTTNATWPAGQCLIANPQNTVGAYRWDRSNAGTSSTLTGPLGPFEGGMYAYTEASSGLEGAIATLDMQVVDVSALTTPALTFYYHMWGATMGTLNVQASTDGVNYTTELSLIGQQQPTQASPWAEAVVNLAAYAGGNLYVRFQAVRGSSFDGDMGIDAISIGEAPSCLVPTGLAISSVSTTALSASWTVEPNAGDYNWEVRTSGAAGSGPGGLVEAGTTASNSFSTSVLLTENTTYFVYVQSDCTDNSDGLSNWSSAVSAFTGYCVPNATSTDGQGITRVVFSTVDNNTADIPPYGYGDFSALVGAVAPGATVPVDITYATGYAYTTRIWIDWNQDLDFTDAGEEVFAGISLANNPTTLNASFTVPGAQGAGTYRMRIGGRDGTFGLPSATCEATSWSSYEDYSISICEPATATASVVDDCVGQTFQVSVTATDLGSGSSAVIEYAVNGVPQTPVAYTGPGTLLPAQASHLVVTASIVTDEGCATDLGVLFSGCDIELDCAAPSPIEMVHCYDNGDTRTWTWVNPGGEVTLRFVSGEMETNDNILLWDGVVGSTSLATPNGTLNGLLFTSTGSTMSMSISSDGSNSCADDGAGLSAGWVFQARCAGCVEPSGFVTADPNDLGEPEVDCIAGTFNAYVGIIDNGIDGTTGLPPATSGYRLFVDGVQQPDVTGLPGGEFYPLAPYPLGTELTVILLHEDQATQSACNLEIATDFTVGFNACPPANDLCEDAEVLVLNPDGTCPANALTGTTLGADQTGALPECQASGTAQDVWYTFNTGTSSSFTMTLTAATAGNIGVQLFTACGAPAPGACLYNLLPAQNPITITALPATDYWLRVFTDVSAGAPGTFNICVSAFDPCLDIQNIAACGVSTQSTRPAGIGAWTNYGSPFGTPGQERIFTFTPTVTGFHTLEVTNVTGSWVDFFYKPSSTGCNSTGWTYLDDVVGAQSGPSFNMTAGTEYYIMWDPEDQTVARDVTFSISCPLPPPANDDCANATSLSVNSDLSCTLFTAGTVGGATASGDALAPCLGTADDDVWYSFVATSATHTVALNNVAGSTTDLEFALYTGTCGALVNTACSSANTNTFTGLSVGQTYLVRVWTFTALPAQSTTFNICVGVPPAPPVNDDPCGAIALVPGASCSFSTYTTASATATAGVPAPGCANYVAGDVWFSVVVPASGDLTFDSNVGVITDLGLAIYSSSDNTCTGTLTLIECDDDDSVNGLMSFIARTDLTPGSTIFVRAWEFGNDNPGTFNLCVFEPPPPPSAPPNDDCGGAIALTVNPDFSCAVVTAGTTVSATASVQPDDVTGTPNNDVWFSFVATNATHRVSILNVVNQGGGTSTSVDMGHAIYAALPTPCNPAGMPLITSSDPDVSNPGGLIPGNTYYVRVYGWFTTIQNNNFNICIGTPPPPPANNDCAGAISLSVNPGLTCGLQTAGTVQSATGVGPAVAPCLGTADDDVWYTFQATQSSHIVSLNSVVGSSTTMNFQVFSGVCGGFASIACGPSSVAPSTTVNGLTAGSTYYVRVYTNTATVGQNTTFNICVTTPPAGPPANDDCAGAQSLTVNAGQACTAQTFGTVFGATASGGAVAPCVGTADDDVWYSFVATGPVHTVSLNSVVGSVNSMNFNIFSGACGTLTNIGCGATGTAPTTAVAGLTAGATYFVRVYTNTATAGQNTTFNVCVTTPPVNDQCSGAIAVACNSVTAGSTVGSTLLNAPATCTTTLNSAGGVWYTVQGWGGPMYASLCGSVPGFDSKMGVFSGTCGTLVCVGGNDDAPVANPACAITPGGVNRLSRVDWTSTAGTTYYIYVTGFSTLVGDFNLSVQCGSTAPVCSANGLNLEFQNDANPGQVTWELRNQASNLVVLSGANPIPANQIGTQSLCVPDGCYVLRVLDSAGDGMTTGGYELRTSGTDLRIIDNTNNFSTGSVSAISGGQGFCLPLGTVAPIFSSCDKLDWVTNKFIVCGADPDVTAQFGVTNTTSGYSFWFYDPNGSYSFRRFRSHATSDGFGSGATRACHFKLNKWINTPLTPHLPEGVLLNVRVRGVVAGSPQEWGPACQFKMDAALAACPRVKLQDNPANPTDFSCGVSRNFGPGNSPANRIVANPPQPIPVVASNQVRYQFRFRNEERCIVRPPQTSPTLVLNWTTGDLLVCTETYDVDVRVSLDGGATWCFGLGTTDQASNCADTEDWGKLCSVTINPCAQDVQGGSSNLAINGELSLYPNPNNGQQLFLSLSEVAADVTTVTVDIFDMTGKRVSARTIAVQDNFVHTAMDLNGDLAGGLYMVNITAGDKTYTERLVIQP